MERLAPSVARSIERAQNRNGGTQNRSVGSRCSSIMSPFLRIPCFVAHSTLLEAAARCSPGDRPGSFDAAFGFCRQSPEESREAKDSAPVLMSRTGGGDSWADLAELQQAAKKGNPKAETQLGEMLLRGDGIAKDEARGIALLEKAARAGQSAAAFRIGMLLMNGESGVAKDPARALAYFRAAAAGGEAEAFFNIGAAYASARGVKRDYAEALGWLILARQHGADCAERSSPCALRIKSQPADGLRPANAGRRRSNANLPARK